MFSWLTWMRLIMFKRALVASWMPGRGALPRRSRLSFRAFTAADCDAVSLGVAVLVTPSDWEATTEVWSITLEAFSECPVIGATDELGFPVVDGWETGKRLRHLKILEKGERIGLWRGVDFRLSAQIVEKKVLYSVSWWHGTRTSWGV